MFLFHCSVDGVEHTCMIQWIFFWVCCASLSFLNTKDLKYRLATALSLVPHQRILCSFEHGCKGIYFVLRNVWAIRQQNGIRKFISSSLISILIYLQIVIQNNGTLTSTIVIRLYISWIETNFNYTYNYLYMDHIL